MALFITAFITGLLGSFHCMGMCGPIALALPQVGDSIGEKVFSRLLYNIGRMITYACLGLLLGFFGFGLKLAGFQQSISIGAGILIIVMVLFNTKRIENVIGNPFKMIRGNAISKLFKSPSHISVFLIGLLNGILPCGFVYIGLVGSVATQDAWQGALFMVCFGLGTLPMMFGVSMIGQFLTTNMRSKINKYVPAFAILIGCLFILRGLGLGIPYLSPKVSAEQSQVKECCEPKR